MLVHLIVQWYTHENILHHLQKSLIEVDAITGAEDFSFFQQKVPGLYFFLGGKPLDLSPEKAAGHHTPDFILDESGFVLGVKTLSALALDYLEM